MWGALGEAALPVRAGPRGDSGQLLQEAVDFLEREKGMPAADAYALASLAVDLGIGEAVDVVNLVYARIPKHIFKSNPEFWYRPERVQERILGGASK